MTLCAPGSDYGSAPRARPGECSASLSRRRIAVVDEHTEDASLRPCSRTIRRRSSSAAHILFVVIADALLPAWRASEPSPWKALRDE